MTKPLCILIFFSAYMIVGQSTTTSIADSLYTLGNYTKAINEYAKINDANATHQIARAYEAMGNHAKAITQYESVINSDTENLLAKFELGKILDKTKSYKKAEVLFKILTEKAPDNPEFYYYLGKVLQEQSNYEFGNAALKKAVDLDSTHLRSIFLLGKYFVAVEEPANAIEILDKGLESAPDDVALLNLKALAHFNNGFFKDAAPLFERLVELGETQPFVLKKLGYSQFKNWDFEKAKKTYRMLEAIPNMEPDAYFGLGEVYLQEKKLDSAETYFLKSIEERRYIFEDEYRNLGRIANLKGDKKQALDYYKKAWEENTTNQFAYWQVCMMADEYYEDPKTTLTHYEKLLSDYPELVPFLKERAHKRIKELKEEIHFEKE